MCYNVLVYLVFMREKLYLENLCDIHVVKDILNRHGFNFSKSLGQNFIINSNICPRMAEDCSDFYDSGVLEIGPGIGVLTVELAKRFKKVVSVEIDKKLIPILKETVEEYSNVKIINKDILKTDLKELFKTEFAGFKEVNICANLPYYITSEIIMYILENNPGFSSLTVMVQKEAAERITAVPGTRKCGAISLAVRYYGEPQILFDVGRGSFIPIPSVDSSVIRIDMQDTNRQKVNDKKAFFKVVKSAFSQRRKNIPNSISAGLQLPKEKIKIILENLGVDHMKRAEQLSMADFINISNNL